MTATKACASDPKTADLATLCADYLRQEEILLAAAQPMVQGVKEAFTLRGHEAFVAALARHQEFAALLARVNVVRSGFREALSRRLRLAPAEVTLTRALQCVPEPDRRALAADAARLRRLADEMAATNYWISVHLRVHLGAYRRILRDLTNTAAGSGRYGRAGKTESLEYRPLILIHG
jgi:hypothetical protein